MSQTERIIGRRVLRFDTVTSTNDIARDLIRQQADEGTVVTAVEQTLGRGSRGRKWVSPAGANLLVSVILRPRQRVTDLTFVASLAVARYLTDAFGLPARVKWPNDVCVNGKKIAGILIEAAPGAVIVGIGVNLNWRDLPPELVGIATSTALENGSSIGLDQALDRFLSAMDQAHQLYLKEGMTAILSEWRTLDCLAGTEVAVTIDGQSISGMAEGVDDEGRLILRLPDGNVMHIQSAALLLQ